MDIISNINKEEENLLFRYGLFILFFNILTFVNVLFIGKIFNELAFVIIFMILYSPIRILIGGYHCKNAKTCLLVFSLIISFIIMLYKSNFINDLFLICIPIYIYGLFQVKKVNITRKTILIILLLSIELGISYYDNIFGIASAYSIILTFVLCILKK